MSACRRKIVTTGALTSKRLSTISDAAERVYWRVYLASDMYGTMSGDPWDVRLLACPGVDSLSEDVVADAIEELWHVGLFARWVDGDGKIWIHVNGHDKHQTADFLRKRGARYTPQPPDENDTICREETRAPLRRHNGAQGADKGRHSGAPQVKDKVSDTLHVVQGRGVSIETPRSKSAKTDSSRTAIQKPTAEQVQQAIEAHRERIGERNAALVDELVAVMAEGNKTGRVAASKTLRKLWQPLGDMAEQFTPEALEYGLRAAIARPAANAVYVKRAAENYQPTAGGRIAAPRQQRVSTTTDAELAEFF